MPRGAMCTPRVVVVPARLPALLAAARSGDLHAASRAAAAALADRSAGAPVEDQTGRGLFLQMVEALARSALGADHPAGPELAGTLLRTLDGAPADPEQAELRAFALFGLGCDAGKQGHAAVNAGQAAAARALLERAVALLLECLRTTEHKAAVLPFAQAAQFDLARALLAHGRALAAIPALEASVDAGLAAPPSEASSRVLAAALSKLGTLAGQGGRHARAVGDLSAALLASLGPADPARLLRLRAGDEELQHGELRRRLRQDADADRRESVTDACLDLATAEAGTGAADRALRWAELAQNLAVEGVGPEGPRLRERARILRFAILGRLDRGADMAEALADGEEVGGAIPALLRGFLALARRGGTAVEPDLAVLQRLLAEPIVDGPPEIEVHLCALWLQLIGLPRGDAAGREAMLQRMARRLAVRPGVDSKVVAVAARAEALHAAALEDWQRAYAALGRALAALRPTDDPEFAPTVWQTASVVAVDTGRRDAAVLFAKLGVSALQCRRDRLEAMGRGMEDLQDSAVAYDLLEMLLVGAHRYAEATELRSLRVMGELDDAPLLDGQPYRSGTLPSLTEGEAAEAFKAFYGAPEQIAHWLASAMASSERRPVPAAQGRDVPATWPIPRGAPVAVLAHSFGAEAVSISVTLDGETRSLDVAVPGEELAHRLFALLQALRRADADAVRPLAEDAYRLLLEPVRPWLDDAGVRLLALEPSGPLAALPLACLHDGTNWLLHRFAVVRLPALPLADLTHVPRRPPRLALFGNRDGAATTDLAAVEAELAAVEAAARHAQLQTEARRGSAFDLRGIAAAVADGATVLHLATHAEADPAYPARSRLATGSGWIAGAALRGLDLSGVELAVLSACETAVPSGAAGRLGAVGLDTLLLEAGASATLASLWRVGDRGTARLMSGFYRALLGPQRLGKAEALRAAQLELLNDPALSAPYHWGAFVLSGNWLGFG